MDSEDLLLHQWKRPSPDTHGNKVSPLGFYADLQLRNTFDAKALFLCKNTKPQGTYGICKNYISFPIWLWQCLIMPIVPWKKNTLSKVTQNKTSHLLNIWTHVLRRRLAVQCRCLGILSQADSLACAYLVSAPLLVLVGMPCTDRMSEDEHYYGIMEAACDLMGKLMWKNSVRWITMC